MPSGDSRKAFICNTAGYYFGLSPDDEAITGLSSVPALNNFLDDGASSLLSVVLDGKKVVLSNKVRD
jgi:hypothetical protein